MKIILRFFLIFNLLLLFNICAAQSIESHTQIKPIIINKSLISKLAALKPDSANVSQVEKIIGKPCCCFSLEPRSEAWTCQWKGNLNSNRIENTLNIQFEAGMIANISATTVDLIHYSATLGSTVKEKKLL
jgi:hypothetical protein